MRRFTSRDGMYSDQAFQVLEDARGRLWLNGNKGIYNVAKGDLISFALGHLQRIPCVSYGKSEGIKVTESSGPASPAGCIDRQGRMWFPTIRGLAMFDPDRQRLNQVEPPVRIEEVRINGRSCATGQEAPLIVPPGQGDIEIDYTAISFLLVDKMRFAYRLDGYDADWVQAGTRRSAFYTNLPPGNYTFRLIAGNGDGVWNRKGASFAFILKPFFTQTALFKGLLALGSLLLVAGFFIFLLRRAKAREHQLERIVDQRTLQLQHLARYDGLTDLANHRTFYETFHKEWAVAGREKKPLALIAADIDHFKQYNDNLGHQQGDDCLRKIAAAIRAQAKRPADLAARTGGDEFFLLLPGTANEGALAIAEAIRAAVADLAIPPSRLAGLPRRHAQPGCGLHHPAAHHRGQPVHRPRRPGPLPHQAAGAQPCRRGQRNLTRNGGRKGSPAPLRAWARFYPGIRNEGRITNRLRAGTSRRWFPDAGA